MAHILRYYIHEKSSDRNIKDIIEFSKRTGCREVYLFTTNYLKQPSFLKLEVLQEYVDKMKKWVKTMEENDIEVYVNVMQTLGHRNFPFSDSKEFPFQRQIYSDGRISEASACPFDESLGNYLSEVYKIYAQLKPKHMFVDDDYRYLLQGWGCMCPLHLGVLSKRSGRDITREELLDELFKPTNNLPSEIKLEYHNVQVEALRSLAVKIREAVHEISPETQVGLMLATAPLFSWGHDFDLIAKAFAGENHKPLLRPHIYVYTDTEQHPIEFFDRFMQPAIIRNLVDENTDFQPEIDNYSFTYFSKTPQMTLMQMTTVHLLGFHRHTLSIFDYYGNPFSHSKDLTDMFEKHKEFFDELIRLIPEGTKSSGISLWQHPQGHIYHRIRNQANNSIKLINPSDLKGTTTAKNMMDLMPKRKADIYVPLLGLPVGFQWDNPEFLFISGDDILALSDTEKEKLLSNGAILDRRACECLINSGWGDRLGIEFEEGSDEYSDEEYYECTDFCKEYCGTSSPNLGLVKGKYSKIVIKNGVKSFVLSKLVNVSGEEISPLVVAVENSVGKRFGILAFDMDELVKLGFMNLQRTVQLRNLISWVSRKELPAAVFGHPYIVPIYIDLDVNTSILALSNYSTSAANNYKVKLGRKTLSEIEYLTHEGKWINADNYFSSESLDCLKAEKTLYPYEVDILKLKWN